MFHIVLFEPEIAPNTGNIIRLCANTGANLHLIKPLGFRLDDRKLRRAGLDYLVRTCMQVHESLEQCLAGLQAGRVFAFSTKGRHTYHKVRYQPGDVLMFGPETRGLPESLLSELDDNVVRIPMRAGERSLNLSNSVAIGLYEAWRQQGFTE